MNSAGPPPQLMALLDRAFGHPRGVLGRLGGVVMAYGNAATERHVTELAAITGGDTVLVIGPGPGVGLRAAADRAGLTIGVDPSDEMLASCRDRCADLLDKVRLRRGTAERTGLDDASADVIITVNNVQLWDDRPAAFAELFRVLRPRGRLVLSSHEKWLPVPRLALAAEVEQAGFTEVQSWTWDPPGPLATRACQLRARKALA